MSDFCLAFETFCFLVITRIFKINSYGCDICKKKANYENNINK